MAANVAATNCGQQTSNNNASKRNDGLETQRTASKAGLSASSTGNRIDNPRPLDDMSNGNDVAGATDVIVVYDVEHLATFSTAAANATATTNGSHETATNNGGSKQQVNNDSKTKPHALADDHNDNDDPATAAAASVESGRTCYGGDCGNVLAGRSKAAAFDSCIDSITTPKVALRRLFELEKLSGIWTQRMQIELRHNSMLIVDCETNSVVEKFDKTSVTKPEAFNEYNHIYNNIVVFIIRQQQRLNSCVASDKENAHSSKADANFNKNDDDDDDDQIEGELHIFQCVSQQAQQLVQDIQDWKSSKLQQQVRRAATTQQTSGNRNSGGGKQTTSEMAKLIINSGISSKCNNHDDDSNVKTKVAPSSTAENNSNGKLKSSSQQHKQQAATDSPRAAGKPVVTVASSSSANENVPVVNVNVKETVQVFNQIAALREKSKPGSPTNAAGGLSQHQQQRPLSDASAASSNSSSGSGHHTQASSEKAPLAPPAPPLSNLAGAFFKQRSIRAKLNPADQDQQQQQHQKSRVANNSNNSSDSTTASCSSSSSASDRANKHQIGERKQLLEPSTSRHTTGLAKAANNACSTSSGSNRSNGFNQNHQQQLGEHHSSKHHHHHQSSSASASSSSNGHRAPLAPPLDGHVQPAPAGGSHQQVQKTKSSSAMAAAQQQQQTRQRQSAAAPSRFDQVTTNESYVSVLNHCFDDIEKFILKLQQAMAASRELQQARRKLSKRGSSSAAEAVSASAASAAPPLTTTELSLLSARVRGPNEEDYFEILSKFKLAFNLLAKLKGCIHEPNAPELVHFLFTPLAIIIESARNAKPAIDPTLVGIPYLNQEALDLLSNCCTSKEYDMWMSLGPNWIQTIDTNLLKASRMPSSFQPIFSDGWAPVIGELELIGLVAPPPSPPAPHSSSSAVGSFDHHMGAQQEATIPQPAGDGPAADRQHRSRHRHEGHLGARAARRLSAQATGYSAAMPLEAGDHSPPRATRAARNGHHNHQHQHHLPLSRHLSEPAAAGYHEPSGHLYGGGSYAETPIAAADAAELASPYRSSREIYHRPRHQGAPPRPSNRSGSVERRPNLMRNVLPALGGGGRPLSHSKSSGNRLVDLHHPQPHHHNQYQATGPPLPALIDEHRHAMAAHPSDRYAKGSMALASPPPRPYTGGNSRKQRHLYEPHDEPAAMMFAPAPEDDASDYFNPDDPDELDMQPRGGLHEAMLLDLGPAQMDWFYELQSRGAMIVRVLFSRAANNDKELSVRRGELLEILDDSRKWWRARNIDLQVAHVPHTIVAPMQGYQTLDDLLANNPSQDGAAGEEPSATNFFASQHSSSAASSQHYARNPMMNQHHHPSDEWIHAGRNPKNAGAFRYF